MKLYSSSSSALLSFIRSSLLLALILYLGCRWNCCKFYCDGGWRWRWSLRCIIMPYIYLRALNALHNRYYFYCKKWTGFFSRISINLYRIAVVWNKLWWCGINVMSHAPCLRHPITLSKFVQLFYHRINEGRESFLREKSDSIPRQGIFFIGAPWAWRRRHTAAQRICVHSQFSGHSKAKNDAGGRDSRTYQPTAGVGSRNLGISVRYVCATYLHWSRCWMCRMTYLITTSEGPRSGALLYFWLWGGVFATLILLVRSRKSSPCC